MPLEFVFVLETFDEWDMLKGKKSVRGKNKYLVGKMELKQWKKYVRVRFSNERNK